MRDLVLAGVFGVLLLAAIKQPVIAAYLWAWFSLMNPHKLTYGFAFNLPFAQITALAAITLVALTKHRTLPRGGGIILLQMLMLAHMSFTCLFAMTLPEVMMARWVAVLKIHLMLLITWALVTDARQLRTLIWVVALSVGFFGIKGGLWTLVTGGGSRVWGPPGGMLADNNSLAVGLVMILPLVYFLHQTEKNRWLRLGLFVSIPLIILSVLGSQSRGALLAIVAMAITLGLKGAHPLRTLLGLTLALMIALTLMPDSWWDRMDTIQGYQADGSAMSRIWTWTTLWNAAVDRPLVGTGFGADTVAVFAKYAPRGGAYDMLEFRVYVAHSIYFQMLGEHGFPGLLLFLSLGLTTWLVAGRLARRTASDEAFRNWVPLLMRMVQVSLVGYAVGGAFLSLAYLDLPYYIMGFVITVNTLVTAKLRRGHSTVRAAAGQPAVPSGSTAP